MQNLKQLLNNLIVEESGQDLIEYALVACLVGLAAVATMRTLGTTISSAFTNINTSLSGAI